MHLQVFVICLGYKGGVEGISLQVIALPGNVF